MYSLIEPLKRALSLIIMVAALGVMVNPYPACAEERELENDASVQASPDVHRYVVRGTIRQLPSKPGGELFIRHEPIPDYVNRDGKVVGMHAMTMPFWIAEGVSLDEFASGDRVEFTFESRWHPKPEDKIVAIRKIDAES